MKNSDRKAIAKLYAESFDGASDGPEAYVLEDSVSAIITALMHDRNWDSGLKEALLTIINPKNIEEAVYSIRQELSTNRTNGFSYD